MTEDKVSITDIAVEDIDPTKPRMDMGELSNLLQLDGNRKQRRERMRELKRMLKKSK